MLIFDNSKEILKVVKPKIDELENKNEKLNERINSEVKNLIDYCFITKNKVDTLTDHWHDTNSDIEKLKQNLEEQKDEFTYEISDLSDHCYELDRRVDDLLEHCNDIDDKLKDVRIRYEKDIAFAKKLVLAFIVIYLSSILIALIL